MLGTRPTGGRAGVPVAIADVPDADAAALLERYGVDAATAADCVALVGGRLVLLERCAGMYAGKGSFPPVRARLMELAALEFHEAGVWPGAGDERSKAALEGVRRLAGARGGGLSAAEWRAAVPDEGLQDKFLESGVARFDGQRVVFGSRLVAVAAAELLDGTQEL